MPDHKSCYKRMRQNEYRRKLNRSYKRYVHKSLKEFRELDDQEEMKERLPRLMSILDRAAKKGIFHGRKTDRLKSRLSRKIS